MKIRIVTDSTCDLPLEVVEKYDITVIPLYINFSDHSYLDGVDITRREFYEKLPDYDHPPTTSVPSIGTFIEAYRKLIEKGATAIISIHISTLLSGVFNVASLAANAVGIAIVKTFDANQLSLGTGLAVEAAAKLAQAGKSVEEILEKISELAGRTHTFAALDTLKYLRRSGRVSMLKAGLGSVLQIKPIMKMAHSKVGMDAARTTRGAYDRLIHLIRSLGPLQEIHLVHTNAPEQAEQLMQKAKQFFPQMNIPYSVDVTPVIGAHIGPGAVGFVCVTSMKG